MQQGRRNRGRVAERQRAQRQSELSEVRRNVRRGVLAFWVKLGWSRVSIKSNGAFCLFFFLNFGLNRPFRPIWLIQARVGLIPGESPWVEAASARVGENHVGSTWHVAAGRAGSGVPCVSPRPAVSDAGAAPLVPRLCFLDSTRLADLSFFCLNLVFIVICFVFPMWLLKSLGL